MVTKIKFSKKYWINKFQSFTWDKFLMSLLFRIVLLSITFPGLNCIKTLQYFWELTRTLLQVTTATNTYKNISSTQTTSSFSYMTLREENGDGCVLPSWHAPFNGSFGGEGCSITSSNTDCFNAYCFTTSLQQASKPATCWTVHTIWSLACSTIQKGLLLLLIIIVKNLAVYNAF